MEGGRLTRTKVGRELDERVDIRVIATANSIGRLPPELLDRFTKFRLNLYSPEEFVEVVRNVLVKREDIPADVADRIAKALVGKTQSPRDAVRVARLSKKLDVERSIELLVRPPLA
jgi:Holliday junction DNA helicase RuvB